MLEDYFYPTGLQVDNTFICKSTKIMKFMFIWYLRQKRSVPVACVCFTQKKGIFTGII